MKVLLPIVEGQADATAVPTLIRRIAGSHNIHDLKLLPPHRRGGLPTVRARLSDFLEFARLEAAPILWVLDYDCKECTDVEADLRTLHAEAKRLAPDLSVKFALLVKEYESLFLVDEATTRKVFKDIPADHKFPAQPESVRGAKEWLSQARPKGSAYKETTHQAQLSAQLNLDVLRQHSASFKRFEQALLELIS